jgi:hypothetical protein
VVMMMVTLLVCAEVLAPVRGLLLCMRGACQ